MTGSLRVLIVLLGAAAAVCAQDKKPQPVKKEAAKAAPAKNAPAKKAAAPKPPPPPDYQFLTDELVVRKDGKLMWFYRTNHVAATNLQDSISKLKIPGIEFLTRKRKTYAFNFDKDEKQKRISLSAPPLGKEQVDENILIIVFPPPYKEIVEEFLDRFDVPTPQVFIKAKVVEVTLDSGLDLGTSITFDRGADKPNAFFRGFTSSFKPASFTEPNASGLSLFFDDLGMDSSTLNAEINALQERGSANILSEPSIVAAQGQLATLVTGTETPISEITIVGSSERISTKFKDTGIRLDFTPLHIGREYVKLRVRVEVSSVTDFLTVQGTDLTVQNPIIAQRNSETVVTLRDGMTFVMGGLYTISEIDDRSGIPLLMDIPGLKYLFSRERKTKVKSELDFFVTPSIVKHRLDAGVFMPPGERERLARIKAKAEGREVESDEERLARETESERDTE